MKQRLCKILGLSQRSGEEQVLAAVAGLREQFEEDTAKLQQAAARHKLPVGVDCVDGILERLAWLKHCLDAHQSDNRESWARMAEYEAEFGFKAAEGEKFIDAFARHLRGLQKQNEPVGEEHF